MKVKSKKLKPIVKTVKIRLCPYCELELTKARPGYECLDCGYNWARPGKTDKQKLIKACDEIFSLIIRSIGHCEVCGREDIQLNAHHIKSRAIMILRYDLRNGVSLCVSYHDLQKESAHKDQEWFKGWLLEHRPDDLDYVESKKNEVAHYSVKDLQGILSRLKETYRGLNDYKG